MDALRIARWLHSGPVPPEYVELQLCRDVYHCLPSALAKEDNLTIERHIMMMQVESGTRG